MQLLFVTTFSVFSPLLPLMALCGSYS